MIQKSQDSMTFGEALELLKTGDFVVRRRGWRGSGRYVFLTKGSQDADETGQYDGVKSSLFERGDKGTNLRMPHLSMCTSALAHLHGFAPSQVDMLAEDWETTQPR